MRGFSSHTKQHRPANIKPPTNISPPQQPEPSDVPDAFVWMLMLVVFLPLVGLVWRGAWEWFMLGWTVFGLG